jgi:TIR domain-containing protein
MGAWFTCLVGLILIGLATRLYRFWQVFPLAFAGSALIFAIATSANSVFVGQLFNYDRFDAPPWILATIGGGLMLFAAVQRRTSVAPASALVGAHILFLGAARQSEDFIAAPSEMLAAALVLPVLASLAFAVWKFRSRLAPITALFALVVLGFVARTTLFEQLSTAFDKVLTDWWINGGLAKEISENILLTAWLVAFATCGLFGPKRAVTRTILYGLIAIGMVAYAGDWGFSLYLLLNQGLDNRALQEMTQWAVEILWLAVPLVLARGRLFHFAAAGEDVVAPDIFISYKRDDRARVEAIAEALRALKLSVWFDVKLVSGKSFDDEINQQIRTAKAVLVCWSRGASASEWVRAEASIARQRGVLRACFLEPCDLVPPFNLVHAEDLSTGALDGANPAWIKLVDQIGGLIGRPGLGSYLTLGKDAGACRAWLDAFGADPLCGLVKARAVAS